MEHHFQTKDLTEYLNYLKRQNVEIIENLKELELFAFFTKVGQFAIMA
jgi:hypothetical protein